MAIRKRILPSGSIAWQCDYRDSGGKRRSAQFAKKSEADAFLTKVKHEMGQGTHVARSASMTFGEAAKKWIAKADADGLERTTVTRYKQTYNLHVAPAFSGMKLSSITPPQIQRHIDDLAGTMSASSLKKVRNCFTQVFGYAVKRGLAGHNPATAIEIPDQRRKESEPVEMPTKAEIRAIIDAAPDKWKVFLRVAVLTGMRASELRGLRWQNVDLDRGVIHVAERVDRYGQFGPPKTKAGRRDIPMSAGMVALLEALPRTGELVFPNEAGGTIDHQNILNRVFGPAQLDAGVAIDTGEKDEKGNPILKPKFGLHALRHAAAALFIEQGLQPKRIQTILGHSSIQMTYDLYGYLFEKAEADREAMGAIESGLFG
ncbi:site-specific integrase [Aquamicrobium lusatiense]|uniref:tyrosine-type recombinase/integrase n=1 Tax=Aquamicrobium lusatiense TaxID=89772 RepID=UPI002456EC1D|nr:site-specific integrase [Aquamicrobium lusatiense]MDH4993320.1 site-specific integrase [Aquamicrobium lusatiense]